MFCGYFVPNVGVNRPRNTPRLIDFPIPVLLPRARGPVQRLVGPLVLEIDLLGRLFTGIIPVITRSIDEIG